MRAYENGQYRDLTAEEIAAIQEEQSSYEAYERTRPLTAEEVTALLIRQQINTLEVADNTALRMVEFYPEWAAGQDYTAGYKVQHSGKLWRCVQAHASQTGWEPENAPALWTEICETHAGTLADPIPAARSMEYVYGRYYSDSEDGKVYLCTRTGEADGGTITLHYLPHELVGLYFQEVTA